MNEWRYLHHHGGKAHLWWRPNHGFWYSRCGRLVVRQLETITDPWTPSTPTGQCKVCLQCEKRQPLKETA